MGWDGSAPIHARLADRNMTDEPPTGLTQDERVEAEELAAPRAPVIMRLSASEVGTNSNPQRICCSGPASRPALTIMASVIAEARCARNCRRMRRERELISDLGYSVGFVIAILGRMQLFTEQTIVTVLPVMAAPGWRALGDPLRGSGPIMFVPTDRHVCSGGDQCAPAFGQSGSARCNVGGVGWAATQGADGYAAQKRTGGFSDRLDRLDPRRHHPSGAFFVVLAFQPDRTRRPTMW